MMGKRSEGYVVVQLILFGLIAAAPLARWGALNLGWAGRGVGVALGAAGGVLALAGLVGLGRNLSPLPKPKQDSELVESGVYGLVRHPIYGGLLLGALGWGLLTSSGLALVFSAALWVLFELKSRREEAWLAEMFAGYAAYRRRTKRFWPFIY